MTAAEADLEFFRHIEEYQIHLLIMDKESEKRKLELNRAQQ